MFVILSGSYIEQELRAEFGMIPPAFLPLGNKPLVSWQTERIRNQFPNETVAITVPETFELSMLHEDVLNKNEIEVVRVPEDLSLAESVLYFLNVATSLGDTLRVLYGDTYMNMFPENENIIGISSTTDDYIWQHADITLSTEEYTQEPIWCGFYCFTNTKKLVRSLALNRTDFISAVLDYFRPDEPNYQVISSWSDCGHLNTYFRSREAFTTQRSFNDLTIRNGEVSKGGKQTEKIMSEAKWFEKLPNAMKKYTPAYYGYSSELGSYRVEYLPMTPLNELFVHGRNPMSTWTRILSMFKTYLMEAHKNGPARQEIDPQKRDYLINKKTWQRLHQFSEQNEIDVDKGIVFQGIKLPSLRKITQELIEEALQTPPIPGILHGDACFSNIVLDSRNGRLRLFDPRGILEDDFNKEDIAYDIAKFGHSIYGLYDLIIADNFEVQADYKNNRYDLKLGVSKWHEAVGNMYLEQSLLDGELKYVDTIPQIILLFLSMLPLHADKPERQAAMLGNAMRLYVNYRGLTK